MTITVAEIRARECRTACGRLRFQIMMADYEQPSYEAWCDLVEDAVRLQADELAKRRHTLQGVSEDGLTTALILGLKMLGLGASSSVVNGNCDVVVEFGDFLWLGEAKIDSGVSKIWGGYLQLTQRYGTGLSHQSRGGMLLYCFRDSGSALLAEWRAALQSQRPACDAVDGRASLTFHSSDVVEATGLAIRVMHFAVSLRHSPTEDIERLTDDSLSMARNAKKKVKAEGGAALP